MSSSFFCRFCHHINKRVITKVSTQQSRHLPSRGMLTNLCLLLITLLSRWIHSLFCRFCTLCLFAVQGFFFFCRAKWYGSIKPPLITLASLYEKSRFKLTHDVLLQKGCKSVPCILFNGVQCQTLGGSNGSFLWGHTAGPQFIVFQHFIVQRWMPMHTIAIAIPLLIYTRL